MPSTNVDLDRSDVDDSFRTCDDCDGQAAEKKSTIPKNDVTRPAVSFSPSARRLTEETLYTGNCSILVSSRGPGDSDDSNKAGAEMHFSDEKEELIPDDDEDNSLLDDGEDNDLPEDSFSMLFVARWDRANLRVSLWEYLLPICVFGLQMIIMILLMINLLQTSDRQLLTPMNVPVEVPTTVKISQYIACMVSVFTAQDLVTGALHVGKRIVKKDYLRRRSRMRRNSFMRAISMASRNTKNWKWELSNSLRIIEGALVIVVSFIFIVQSATAIDLWLNFAAVQFVGTLDDTAFFLAKNRMLGSTARKQAARLSKFEVYSEGGRNKRLVRRLRLFLFVAIGAAMMGGLSAIVVNQATSTFSCRSLTVTVGEGRHQYARHYSGRYIIQDEKINGRAVYVQEQGSSAFLSYCAGNGINRWTISPIDNDEVPLDPCGKIVLQSYRTKSHDVSEIGDGLKFWTGDDADADIKCNQCDVSRDGGDCSFRGVCADDKLCKCNTGYFGDACQFSGPCTEMAQHDEFHGLYNRGYQKTWELMYLNSKPVMVYDRPVYVQNTDNDIFDIILYDGGRWFVSQSDYFFDWFNTYSGKESAYNSLAKYLTKSFNARDADYIASYISVEPSALGSPSNLPFKAWLAEAAEDSIGKLGEEEYELLCADCDNGDTGEGLSFCVGEFGETNKELCKPMEHEVHGLVNRCACLPGFAGPLCHMRPVEGSSSLHLDHASGRCLACYEDNPWTVWDVGVKGNCQSMGRLRFQDVNDGETFYRQLGLNVNASHFSVFVSSNNDNGGSNKLCTAQDGTEELYAVRRDDTDERVYVNLAVHLKNEKDDMGKVEKPERVDCLSSVELDHDVCRLDNSLAQEYSKSDMNSELRNAWLLLNLKITPNLDGQGAEDDTISPVESLPPEEESLVTVEEASSTQPTEGDLAQPSLNISSTIDVPPMNDSIPTQNETIILVDAIPNQNDTIVLVDATTTQNNTSVEPTLSSSSSLAVTTSKPTDATLATAQDDSLFSAGDSASETYTFAVIPKATDNPFFIPVKDGCEARAKALSRQSVRGGVSVKCMFVGPVAVDVEEQKRVALDLIKNGSVDGISISVIDEAVATEIIDEAVAADIPIITFDSDAPQSKREAYVGTDNLAFGEELALLLLTRFSKSGKFALVSDNNPNLSLRETGIRNILNENDWKEVPGSPLHVGQSMTDSGPIDMMVDLMKKQPDIDAMMLTLGVPMWSGEEGQWESFVQSYPDLLIISADSMPVQIDLLNRGFVNGLVGQQPYDMGAKSIDTLLAISKGNEVNEIIPTRLVLIGRVGESNPYNQLDMFSPAATRTTSSSLILIFALLGLICIVLW